MASRSLLSALLHLAATPLVLWTVGCNPKEDDATSETLDPTFCVAAGTRVATPSGWVAVESLRPGDRVYAVDVATGRVLEAALAAVRRSRRECLALVADGHELRVTPDHPIYSPEHRGFVEAGRFALGQVTSVLRVDAPDPAARARTAALGVCRTYAGLFDVYDLTLEGDHPTFIAEGFVVHNKSTCADTQCPETSGPTSGSTEPTSSTTDESSGSGSDSDGTGGSTGDGTGGSTGSTGGSTGSTGGGSTGGSTGGETGDAGFPCGRQTCDLAGEYCSVFHPGQPDGMITHTCEPLPDACVAEPTCVCLAEQDVFGDCSVTPEGGLQIDIFAP